jgi:hypothetical protein
VALNLYLVSPDAAARERYAEVVRSFVEGSPANGQPGLRRQLVANPTEPTAWFWSDVWGSYAMPGQDVSHGNGVITFAVEAHDHGVGLGQDDLRRFVRTFTEVVWPRPGPGAHYVGGAGTGTGWFSDGFVKLGRYDARLQRRLETHQPANGQFFAAAALNAAILSCTGPPSAQVPESAVDPQPPACRAPVGLNDVGIGLRPPA